MKIIRLLEYEGDEEWLRKVIANSISELVFSGGGRWIRERLIAEERPVDFGALTVFSVDWPHRPTEKKPEGA